MTHGTAAGYRWHRCRCPECRAHHAAQERERAQRKRAAGLHGKGRMPACMKKPQRPPWNAVPSDRIWPLIDRWIEEHNGGSRFSRPHEGGLAELARRLGVDAKSISKIPESGWISFARADRILVAMDRLDLWHSELADIYNLERETAGQAA